MGALGTIYLKKEILAILLSTVEKKNDKGVEITISINDNTNEYGQNVNSYVSQTKEQRENKTNKFFTGSGKVFWTDGVIKVAEKLDQKAVIPASAPDSNSNASLKDDLPF
jgi:hypothetical protein